MSEESFQIRVLELDKEKFIDKFFVSELGFLMIKIWDPKKKVYSTRSIGSVQNILSNSDIQVLEISNIKKSIFDRGKLV